MQYSVFSKKNILTSAITHPGWSLLSCCSLSHLTAITVLLPHWPFLVLLDSLTPALPSSPWFQQPSRPSTAKVPSNVDHNEKQSPAPHAPQDWMFSSLSPLSTYSAESVLLCFSHTTFMSPLTWDDQIYLEKLWIPLHGKSSICFLTKYSQNFFLIYIGNPLPSSLFFSPSPEYALAPVAVKLLSSYSFKSLCCSNNKN